MIKWINTDTVISTFAGNENTYLQTDRHWDMVSTRLSWVPLLMLKSFQAIEFSQHIKSSHQVYLISIRGLGVVIQSGSSIVALNW